MGLLLNVLIAAVVALVFFFVLTALVTFNHSVLIFGLIAAAIFIWLAFFAHLETRVGRRY